MSLTLSLWRIASDTPDYEADDLSGAGAEKAGGRWNSKGHRLIYSSPSISLACLETWVHLNDAGLPLNRYLVNISVPADVWEKRLGFGPSKVPVGWDALPQGRASINFGNAWVNDCPSALMEVPSVVVPEELNVLINPKHPDVAKISAWKIRRWQYDSRLVKS